MQSYCLKGSSIKLLHPVAQRLAKRFRHLELFITGQIIESPRGQRNVAAQYRLLDGEIISVIKQSKHHRWRLEESQIRQYQLGGIFDPSFIWGEHIDVLIRSIGFSIEVVMTQSSRRWFAKTWRETNPSFRRLQLLDLPWSLPCCWMGPS